MVQDSWFIVDGSWYRNKGFWFAVQPCGRHHQRREAPPNRTPPPSLQSCPLYYVSRLSLLASLELSDAKVYEPSIFPPAFRFKAQLTLKPIQKSTSLKY